MISNEEKYNLISKSLQLLKIMIEKSEVKGTARVKSHSGLLKQKILILNINDDTSTNYNEFEVRVYGNTTIWEMKEILSKKINVTVDFLKFIYKREEIKNTDHGKTLIDLKVLF